MSDKIDIRVYPYYKGDDSGKSYSEEVPVWELNENGEPSITGYTNIQEYIQSFADECDINKIILSHLGADDLAALADKGDAIADTSIIPDSIHDIYKSGDYARDFYNSLSPEQKALFKNYDEFTQKYTELFNKNPIESEPKDNE